VYLDKFLVKLTNIKFHDISSIGLQVATRRQKDVAVLISVLLQCFFVNVQKNKIPIYHTPFWHKKNINEKGFKSSGMWLVVGWLFSNVSTEHGVFIFMVTPCISDNKCFIVKL